MMSSLRDISATNVICAFLAVFILNSLVRRKRKNPLPPGPKGYPLVGNILDIPSKHAWMTFSNWGKQYGNICSITVFGQPIVILNSAESAREMLDIKGSNYSDRPVLQFCGDLVGWKNTLILLPYGERFRRYRRLISGAIGSHANMKAFSYINEVETHRFLRCVLANPADLSEHVKHTAIAIIMSITYGYQVKEHSDYFVELGDKATNQFSLAATPGRYFVDVLPIVRHVPTWFPGGAFKRTAKEWAATLAAMVDQPYEFVKRELARGKAPKSFISNLLEGKSVDSEDEFDIKWCAASLYAGGAHTTVSSIYSFFLAMTLNPEVMKKAQAEIDSVVGNDRLPTLEDRPHLPYLNALTKEVHRWNVVAPLSIVHRSNNDDVHDGYRIPRGAFVIVNIRGILHDPRVYPNPQNFHPERFIASDNSPIEPDPRNVCFGFGRRACPGLYLADAAVFISCAMSLAVFDISKPVENGVVSVPVYEATDGTVSHPKPFKCTIRPRSEKAISLIRDEDSKVYF